MFAHRGVMGRVSVLGVAILVSLMASKAVAGPIAVGSLNGGPPLLGSLQPGTVIGSENLVTTQFRNLGLDNTFFQHLAVSAMASINGTTALVPVVSNGNGYNLDFGGFVGFQIVRPTPTSDRLPTTNYLSVEFVGPHAETGFLYAMTPTGGIISATYADDGIGPNGGRLATLQFDGIGMFAAWSGYDPTTAKDIDQMKWGISAITFDSAFPPIDDGGGNPQTPEPATLSLAGVGIFGVASALWKRRRKS